MQGPLRKNPLRVGPNPPDSDTKTTTRGTTDTIEPASNTRNRRLSLRSSSREPSRVYATSILGVEDLRSCRIRAVAARNGDGLPLAASLPPCPIRTVEQLGVPGSPYRGIGVFENPIRSGICC